MSGFDKIVAVVLEVSRSVAKRAIDAGGVTHQGSSLGASDKLSSGTRFEVELPDEPKTLSADESVAFEVVREDPDMIVVNKPAGLVVHPSSPRSEGTLVHGLLARYPSIRGVGQEGRWGIVHRLDRDTSGLLVVALTNDAYHELVEMMRQRAITRRYLAVVHGTFDGTLGTIDAPIGRDPSSPMRMTLDREGRAARTHYRRLAQWGDIGLSYLSVTLETGRTHQIRVPHAGDRPSDRRGSCVRKGWHDR